MIFTADLLSSDVHEENVFKSKIQNSEVKETVFKVVIQSREVTYAFRIGYQ